MWSDGSPYGCQPNTYTVGTDRFLRTRTKHQSECHAIAVEINCLDEMRKKVCARQNGVAAQAQCRSYFTDKIKDRCVTQFHDTEQCSDVEGLPEACLQWIVVA